MVVKQVDLTKIKRAIGKEQKISPQFLKHTLLFADLNDKDLALFSQASQYRSYSKGKILYLQGEEADSFYIVCEGWIKLFHTLIDGQEVIVDMITKDHMVGESAIFESGHHTTSAQVIENVKLLSIPSKLLKEQIQINPSLALSMLSSMSRHHSRHYNETALNAMQNAPQRIGAFLLRLCPDNLEENIVLHLPYDKNLIAYTLGMKGSTFSRALNILRLKTNMRMNGTRVEFDSKESLVKFVYGPYIDKYLPIKS